MAIVKLGSEPAARDFMKKWNVEEFKFKGGKIRAREDRAPEKRLSDGKVYGVMKYLETTHLEDFDIDLRHGCVWWGDEKLVEWKGAESGFEWNDGAAQKLKVDKAAATAYTAP